MEHDQLHSLPVSQPSMPRDRITQHGKLLASADHGHNPCSQLFVRNIACAYAYSYTVS